jgi:tRNA threonylcarbamoyladenosine biosynthesis protein TsaE
MSITQQWQLQSSNQTDTFKLAASIGEHVRGGEIIELVGDLGAGKTAFVQGLASGMGSTDQVTSPTFTISNQYQTQLLTLYHFDFYRLGAAGIMTEELAESMEDPQAVTVIEWAGLVENQLPQQRLVISIKVVNELSRSFTITGPASLSYLLEGVQV